VKILNFKSARPFLLTFFVRAARALLPAEALISNLRSVIDEIEAF
jgi:hypothetical protein